MIVETLILSIFFTLIFALAINTCIEIHMKNKESERGLKEAKMRLKNVMDKIEMLKKQDNVK